MKDKWFVGKQYVVDKESVVIFVTLKTPGCRKGEFVFLLILSALVFQNPLTTYISSFFSYIDELFALIGILLFSYVAIKRKKITVNKSTVNIVIYLLLFVFAGLLSNIIYEYQPADLVLKDLYVNLKFYLSILSGFMLFRYLRPRKEIFLGYVKGCTVCLMLLYIIDLVFNVFPEAGYRYGIKVRPLFFGHVTYMAAVCVFLLSVLVFYFEKKNIKYMVMGLLLLFSTLRSKAVAGGIAYILLLYLVLFKRKKIKAWHIAAVAMICIYYAWDQIKFYYIDLAGSSAREVLTQTSLEILRDYFPIGTGFGTFASDVAGEFYSPVYVKYGFLQIYELRAGSTFLSDTFWPIVIGQTGFIGTVCYLMALVKILAEAKKIKTVSISAYTAVLFIFSYLIISSTSEATFCNAVSIPLAMVLGISFFQIGESKWNHVHNAQSKQLENKGACI